MKIKCLVFDLDNTVYSVASIGDKLFRGVFEIIEKHGGYRGCLGDIKKEIMRRPFQDVSRDFKFDEDLTAAGLKMLSTLTYGEPIEPYSDYYLTRAIECEKILVTSGFTKLQWSKIERLGIKNDFDEIIIVDPAVSCKTKKDIFEEILVRHHLAEKEVLVIGDDVNSEITAGRELGMGTVVYDHAGLMKLPASETVIAHFGELANYL
jgi:putative hydrolase of the HAD superfamily